MQALLDKPIHAAPTYAANDPINQVDPTGMSTEYKYFDGCSKAFDSVTYFLHKRGEKPRPRKVSFLPACNYHDMCLENIWDGAWYADLGARNCHDGLKKGIKAECKDRLTDEWRRFKGDCNRHASAYQIGVIVGCTNCWAELNRSSTGKGKGCTGARDACRMDDATYADHKDHWDNWPKAWGKCTNRCDH